MQEEATCRLWAPTRVQKSAAYLRAIEATSDAITRFVADAAAGLGTIDDLELIVHQKVFDRDKARFNVLKAAHPRPNPRALQPLDRIAEAQDAWFEAERVSARAGAAHEAGTQIRRARERKKYPPVHAVFRRELVAPARRILRRSVFPLAGGSRFREDQLPGYLRSFRTATIANERARIEVLTRAPQRYVST